MMCCVDDVAGGCLVRDEYGRFLLDTTEGRVCINELPVGTQEIGGLILTIQDDAICRDVAIEAGQVRFQESADCLGMTISGIAIFGGGTFNYSAA